MAFMQAHFSSPHSSCWLASLVDFHRQDTHVNNSLSEPARRLVGVSWDAPFPEGDETWKNWKQHPIDPKHEVIIM